MEAGLSDKKDLKSLNEERHELKKEVGALKDELKTLKNDAG